MTEKKKKKVETANEGFPKGLNLHQKILRAMEKVHYIQNDAKIDMKKGRGYNYLTAIKMVRVVREEMIALKISMQRTEISLEDIRSTSGNYPQTIATVRCTYKFTNVEDYSDNFSVMSMGSGMDSGDKFISKAQTMAKKYALDDAYQIARGDDPDDYRPEEEEPELKGDKINLAETLKAEKVPEKVQKEVQEEVPEEEESQGTQIGKLAKDLKATVLPPPLKSIKKNANTEMDVLFAQLDGHFAIDKSFLVKMVKDKKSGNLTGFNKGFELLQRKKFLGDEWLKINSTDEPGNKEQAKLFFKNSYALLSYREMVTATKEPS